MTLVAHYPLQEDSGSTAYDFSGNNNDGTVNGATQGATGLLGTSAYSFNATDDYVDIPNDFGIFDGSRSFTVAGWFRPRDVSANQTVWLASGERNVNLGINDTDGFHAFYSGSSSAILPGNIPTENSWFHGILRYDSSGGFTLFQNASSVASNSDTPNIGSDSGDSLIGAGDFGGGRKEHFDGFIADFRIYDHALSPTSIQYLYQSVTGQASISTEEKTL